MGADPTPPQERPKKPSLREYGLTRKDYDHAKHEEVRLASCEAWDIPYSVVIRFAAPWLALLLGVGLLLYRVAPEAKSAHWPVLGLPAFVAIYAYAFHAARRRMQQNLQKSPMIRKIESYEQAMDHYREAMCNYKRILEDHWRSLRGGEFERELGDLYQKLGYAVHVTKGSGDGGIDLILERNGNTTVVQCKGHAKPIGVGAARDLYGALMHSGAKKAILACPAGFTPGVVAFVQGKPIELVSALELVAMAENLQSKRTEECCTDATAEYERPY